MRHVCDYAKSVEIKARGDGLAYSRNRGRSNFLPNMRHACNEQCRMCVIFHAANWCVSIRVNLCPLLLSLLLMVVCVCVWMSEWMYYDDKIHRKIEEKLNYGGKTKAKSRRKIMTMNTNNNNNKRIHANDNCVRRVWEEERHSDTCVFHLNLCTRNYRMRRVPFWMDCMHFDPYKAHTHTPILVLNVYTSIVSTCSNSTWREIFVHILSSLWL